jgi:hypothetical protein
MSYSVLKAICDADECGKLEAVSYSTNPRELVTVQQMIESEENLNGSH